MTGRAFLLGILFIPILCFWNVYSDVVAQSTELAVMSLSIAVVFLLMVLLCINAALKRWLPRHAFTQAELLFLYIFQTTSITISSVGMVQFLNMGIANIFHFATPENEWAAEIHPFLRRFAFPDPSVLPDFYRGESTFFTAEHLRGWLSPIVFWSAFIVALLFVMLCVNTILRRRWIEQERLTFPLIILPLEMTRPSLTGTGPRGFFSSKTMWLGFLTAFALQTLAGIAFLYPSIPYLPIKPSEPALRIIDPEQGGLFYSSPWNAIGTMELGFYPMVIGVVYLLPLDVSFSAWFFFFVRKAEDVLMTAFGFRSEGASPTLARMPYYGEQALGAFLGLAAFSLWGMRDYLKQVWRTVLRPGTAGTFDDRDEPLSYRTAVFGVAIGLLALTGFGLAVGLSAGIGLLFFLLYFLVIITYTRIRAEAGLPWSFGPDMTPHQLIAATVGTQSPGMANLVGLTQFQWMDLDYRTTVMPNQFEAMKLAQEARLKPRQIGLAIVVASVVGVLAAWVSILSCYYRFGASSANVDEWRTSMGNTPWNILNGWMSDPGKWDWPRLGGVGAGVLITCLLAIGRAQFFWWPFHPTGYALAGTFTMPWLWSGTLLGWMIKGLILRYGGMRAYRAAFPFFVGLILGDYVSGSLWALLGLVLGVSTYRVAPI
ncbi:MAG: DUF6785 family protein [Capsulimonadales bacterium]|nr:DUF6785 family protein [Capsulimonadales bacterium]